jgi:predicted nucleotidyltransferase
MNIFQKLNKEELIDMFDILENTFKEFNIDYYVIGALARDIIITGKYDISIPRSTRDVDIAVLIPYYKVFDNLKKCLVEKGFKEHITKGYRLFYNQSIILDLFPFGDIENKDNVVKIYGREIHNLSVFGFNELKGHTEIIEYSANKSFKVTSLPAICVLKLIAWNDRPSDRLKDIDDIVFIISKYFDIYYEDICNYNYDLLNNIFDPDTVSARSLGRDIAGIIISSLKVKDAILNILKENTNDVHSSKLAVIMCSFNNKYVEDNFNILAELLKGIKERLNYL